MAMFDVLWLGFMVPLYGSFGGFWVGVGVMLYGYFLGLYLMF